MKRQCTGRMWMKRLSCASGNMPTGVPMTFPGRSPKQHNQYRRRELKMGTRWKALDMQVKIPTRPSKIGHTKKGGMKVPGPKIVSRIMQQKNAPRSHQTEDNCGNYSLRSGPPAGTRSRSNLNRGMRDATSTLAIYSVTHEYTFLPTATVSSI